MLIKISGRPKDFLEVKFFLKNDLFFSNPQIILNYEL